MSTVEPGSVLVERYRLSQQASTDLAAATAWEAHDLILDREVRVTLVTGPYASDALDSARRAALVTDPRLVRVLDAGSDSDGHKYVVTEPHTGTTLTEIVSSGLVDEQQARAIVGEAASALSVARARGVHHTALRPEAVRVDGHEVRVTGLGLDGGLASGDTLNGRPGQLDAQGLVALLYYAMTARWPGQDLEADWIAKDTLIPLPAQLDESGAVAPLSTLVPHVDTDIDALVGRAFNAPGSTDGPMNPDDVTTALAPWGEVSVVASLPGFVQPEPEGPRRQSIADAFGGEGTPPVRRPVTGRIARNDETMAMGAGSVPAGYPEPQNEYTYEPQAYGGHSPVPPPPPGGGPVGYDQFGQPVGQVQPGYDQAQYAQEGAPQQYPPQYAPGGYDPNGGYYEQDGGFATQPAPKRGGVNPTPIVLGLVGVAVVAGLIWAINAVLSPTPDVIADASPSPTVSASAGGETEGEDNSAPSAPTETEARPVIDSAALLGTLESNGETIDHPEKVELAYDTDPATFYFTTTYQQAVFGGFKDSLGMELRLREPASVTKVELMTNTPGGKVQILKGGAGGEVLAEGTFSETTTFELTEPVVSNSFTIWVTELPQVSDGFRLELNEVVLS
ncbi:protein kinase family protein [Promicromonospora vindobonensis]|uniref:Protein kinase family protein n=1 Tax=Promicromonospora vindobonensis TaxID=195748 RepID=A0ABW5VQP0_9MICO